MITIEAIYNRNIDEERLRQIIALKQQLWPFSEDSHRDWIAKNIRDYDVHLLVLLNGKLTAYLNLVDIEAYVNGKAVRVFGIGNVCTRPDHQKQGWGRLLMSAANCFLKETEVPGILLCHNSVSGLYEKCGWELLSPERKVTVAEKPFTENVMVFNWTENAARSIDIPRIF